MTIVVLAEKPSMARDLARVLGAGGRHPGFLEGHGYRVTWALGHLVHFAEPDDYGPEWAGRWSAQVLPMVPERWKLRTDPRTVEQYRLVKELINAADTERLICATDAGREGEHIFRLIYEHARCRKPFSRLWISSLTDEAIRAGFQALRPGREFEALAAAARARAQADWLVGMNLTRAYTLHNGVLCTIGRVQTPTLAMIVARDQAIARFVKTYFYELVAHCAEGFRAKYVQDGETRIETRAEAERLHRALSSHTTGRVQDIQRQIQRRHPPPLYDLTTLQREANRRFGLTAAQVLEQAQALYESAKLISYPRTESRHLSEDMVGQLPGILAQLPHPLAAEAAARLAAGPPLGKAYVDRTKLTDHHAIIPTGRVPPAGLAAAQQQIYGLVMTRFVAIFLPPQVSEETRVRLEIGEATFLARGLRVLEEGWKRAEARPAATRTAAQDRVPRGEPPLPPLTPGQVVSIEQLELVEKETPPPRPYEDATLLAAMKQAGRAIEDEALAATLKDSGLGTPATRAEMIEKLIRHGYVARRRKQLVATDKGQALIGLVAEPLRSAALTARWEQRLRDIEQGEARGETFYRDIVAFLRPLVAAVPQGPALTPEQVAAARQSEPRRRGAKARRREAAQSSGLGACPRCGQGEVTENVRAYGCSRYREGCGLTIWKTLAGRPLSREEVAQLLAQGRVGPLEGFVSKQGRPFSAGLRLGEDGRVGFVFGKPPEPAQASSPAPVGAGTQATGTDAQPLLPEAPLTCPKCGQGRIIRGRRGYGCQRYREGCDFVVWQEVAGVRLSEAQIRALIATGRTERIEGFSDARGHRLSARLRLDQQWRVVFDFDGEESQAPEDQA